jgi:ATP-dependent RNA helicase DeaD
MTQPAATTTEPERAITFDVLPLGPDVRKAIDALGYENPTPVQVAVFEPATRGRSVVVQARTGTGKTAAFGLPIIDTLVKKSQANVQALILTPTRELALQVSRELERIAQFRGTKIVAIYGGAPMGRQIAALEEGAQIVVGTPGRVLDHLRRGTLEPSNIRIFVLDEADEMLSMGFAKELNAIIETLPKERQGLYFSATIPPDVERLAQSHLKDPEYITLSSDQVGALEIAHYVYLVREGDKRNALVRIIDVEDPESAIVFCNTRDETERLAEVLKSRGYDADWLNGDLPQSEREKVMSATKEGKLRFLVATDVAARGIDISHLTHVINADFPESAEQYVHRTGRTGRAGRTGTAISIVGPKDVGHLYMLRLTYKIRPIERSLPTQGELRTRTETDLVAFLAEAYAGQSPDAVNIAVARRLLTHEQAEVILAGLVADHLGARGSSDVAQDAAEARRARNPPPAREERDAPRTLRDGERRAGRDRDRVRDRDRPREGRDTREGRDARDARPADRPREARDDRHRDDRTDATRPPDRPPPATDPARTRDRRPAPPDLPGIRVEGEEPTHRPPARRERDRRGDRRAGMPHAALKDWEPPAEDDDDKVLVTTGERRALMLSQEDEITATEAPDEMPRPPRRPRERDRDDEPIDPSFQNIFLNVGRRDGVEAGTLVRMLTELAGIPESDTGRIRVRDRITFIAVKKEVADRAIQALAGQVVGGRTISAERARDRT